MYCEIPLEIEETFIDGLGVLDLVAYARVGQKARHTVQSLLSLRCTYLLLPYFSEPEMQQFWNALGNGAGGLTGSAPVWVSQAKPSWTPNDLNAVTAAELGSPVRKFLRRHGWSQQKIDSRIPYVLPAGSFTHAIKAHPPYSGLAATTWKFTKAGHPTITVTETAEEASLIHLLGAKHTMATMFLTPSTLLALHPYECGNRYATCRDGAGLPAQEKVNAAARAYTMGGYDTYFSDMLAACGRKCPGVLRRLRGGAGVGLLRWNTKLNDRVAVDAYGGFMEDHYSFGWTWATCRNTLCDTFLFPRDIQSSLPKSVKLAVNAKENKILRTQHAIEHCSPPFAVIHRGMLFATSCADPFVVAVPLDHGVRKYHTPDDLRAYTWISPRISELPRYPIFMPPHETVGSTVIFHALGWKEDIGEGQSLLLFMTSIHEVGPMNLALAPPSLEPQPVHGDVLLMLEVDGQIQDVAATDVNLLKNAFTRIWGRKTHGDTIGTSFLTSF